MANVSKIELHNKGFIELRTCSGVMGDLAARAHRTASAAGEGMEVTVTRGANRGRSSVRTATFAARKAQAANNALTRAIDAAR